MANSKKQQDVINAEMIATITSAVLDGIRLQGLSAETLVDKPKKLDVMQLMKLKSPVMKKGKKNHYACSRCATTFQTARGFSNELGTGHKQKNWCKTNKKAVSALVKKGAKIV
jgi:hypothetical protein|tara:strand:- start:352 stop:690 length:339 start_codon:yes stop_codon:yes gene_type:complete